MQQGGSQYGVSPEMPQAPPPSYGGPTSLPEAASPISSLPPAAGRGNFDELGPPTGGGGGGFPEEDVAEELERGVAGNRWPRQETLALLKIRSEMDAVFRDATLKGPLWEEVSRKLAESGYSRSAKKCKEKFENVHKYYKRTKEGRAGRQDGKSYKFFSQLEALHSSSNTNTSAPTAAALVASVPPVSSLPPPPSVVACPPNTPPPPVPVSSGIGGSNTMVGSSGRIQPPPPPVTATPPPVSAPAAAQINVSRIGPDLAAGPTAATCGISFSSNSSSSSSSESEDEIQEGPTEYTRKRKRPGSGGRGGGGGGGSGRKMMAFFEGLMKEVIERQEAMQQRFLEAIEKREQDRMIRDEAWKRQEMARLTREHEMMMQERAMAASREAAVMAFLQKMTGQTIQIAQPVLVPVAPAPQATAVLQAIPPLQPPPPQPQQQHHHHHLPPPQQHQPQQLQHQHQQHQSTEIVRHFETDMVDVQLEQQETGVAFETASSSRWPKSEVIALIKMRTGLEIRYQEAGPKGPLWEEISAGMQRLGFKRSSKRCKEKWENINKYFKKVKESNKKRPEDAKTCPYFHHLEALYRKKHLASSSGSKQEQEHSQNPNRQERNDILAIMPPPPPPPQPHPEVEIKSTTITNINKNGGNADGGGSLQVQTSNGGLPPSFFEGPMKKPEDIVKELMEQQQQQSVMDDYDKLDEPDSDNLDQEEDDDDDEDGDDEDEEEEEEDSKMAYKIQFQRPNAGPPNGGANAAAGSFLAMVQKLSSS